jgi:uncharacterized damage-inducible protein DinB
MPEPTRSETETLVRALQRAHDGEPWHGPSRAALLTDVSAEVAAWHPGAGAHSIWETVLHMRSWTDEVARRVLGGARDAAAGPVGGDWPAVTDVGETAWREAVASLDAAHERLIAVVRGLPAAQLSARVGATAEDPAGTGISHASMVRSLAEHDIYHSGQLSLLKRLAREALRVRG